MKKKLLKNLIIKKNDQLVPHNKEQLELDNYLRQISRYKLLTKEQEQELVNSFLESGDINIAKKLVLANLRLVVKIAMEYRSAWQNVMDLIQEGNIGLMKAVSKYNPQKGAKLSYYASWWIRSYILKFILDNFGLIKIGTTNEKKALFFNLMREKAKLELAGKKADALALSKTLNVSPESINAMFTQLEGSKGISLDTPIDDQKNGSKSSLHDILSSREVGPEDAAALSQELKILTDNLIGFLEELSDRDKEIFKKRLLNEVPPSLQELADKYGVSRERIRQIEERLLKNLKVYMSKYIR